jgi:apolipoprotein N-acyltransferase
MLFPCGGLVERSNVFGGFPWIAAQALLVLYCAASALQFLLSVWCAKRIAGDSALPVSFMVSWMVLEILFPRLFPWGLGDFFIFVTPFSAHAELFGSRGLSLLVLFITFLVYRLCKNTIASGAVRASDFTPVTLVIVSVLASGLYLDQTAIKREREADRVAALVIQGNLDIFQKGSMSFLEANLKTYQNPEQKSA